MQAALVLIAFASLQSAAALKVALRKQQNETVTDEESAFDRVQCSKGDGFGAQYHCQMAALAVARHNGKCYVYKAFSPHGFHNRGQRNKLNAAEFTGLKTDADCKKGRYFTVGNPSAAEAGETYYTEKVREELRAMYYSHPQKPEVDAKCQVAIHVRMGDAHGSRRTKNQVIGDAIKHNFADKTVCVYSEGKPSDFGPMEKMKNIVFKLGGPTEDAFHGLVAAPEMVLAKSSFSYAAGLLNKGKVHYISRFWHKTLPSWDKLSLGGSSFARENLDSLVEPPPEDEPSDFD